MNRNQMRGAWTDVRQNLLKPYWTSEQNDVLCHVVAILDIRTKWCIMPCGGHIGHQIRMNYYVTWWPYCTSVQNEVLCQVVAILDIRSEWIIMSRGGHIAHQFRMKYYVMQWSYWIFENISKSNPVPLTSLQQRSLSIISYKNIPRICNISEFSHTF